MAMEDLLRGNPITAEIDGQIVFDQLGYKDTAIWSLLLASGYLRVAHTELGSRRKMKYQLNLTNGEVCGMFEDMFHDVFLKFFAILGLLAAIEISSASSYCHSLNIKFFIICSFLKATSLFFNYATLLSFLSIDFILNVSRNRVGGISLKREIPTSHTILRNQIDTIGYRFMSMRKRPWLGRFS